MTVVEFFDKDAIENIISSLLCNPDKVVFIGESSDAVRSAIEEYGKITHKYGKTVRFSLCSIEENTLHNIVDALEKILEKYGEITIDLTGGGDLYLVAAGIVYNRHPERVQLHRFNVKEENLQDCDADGNVLKSTPENLTIKDNIAIYGGKIIYDAKSSITTQTWDFSDDFIADINTMWNICRKDARTWNSTLNGIMNKVNDEGKATNRLEKAMDSSTKPPKIIEELKKAGLIHDVRLENKRLSFECKNEQVKRCFMKAGQILELKTTRTLQRLDEKNIGKKRNDILNGVVIKWDNFGLNKSRILNEVDVMAMNGLVPIFISCKNGEVNVDELYKLHTVATRFGGKYAKKVLVATEKHSSIVHRAEELGITVIDNIGKSGFEDEGVKEKTNNIFE